MCVKRPVAYVAAIRIRIGIYAPRAITRLAMKKAHDEANDHAWSGHGHGQGGFWPWRGFNGDGVNWSLELPTSIKISTVETCYLDHRLSIDVLGCNADPHLQEIDEFNQGRSIIRGY